MSELIWILLLKAFLCLLAGLANAGCDTLAHHYSQSVFRFWDQQYWGPTSWENKYTRPSYIPAVLTDGWHLMKGIWLIGVFSGVALPSAFLQWWYNGIVCMAVFEGGFMLGYQWLWLRK